MTTVRGSLFMTNSAYTYSDFTYNYPSRPMSVVRSHVESALEHQGYDHDITISYDYSFDTDNYDDSGSDLVELRDGIWRSQWLDGHEDASPHFNLLLLNKDEWPNPDGAGGVSTIGDKGDGHPRGGVILNGVLVGEHSTTSDRYGSADDDVESKIRGTVHEIGHNLGMVHHEGLRYEEYDPYHGFQMTRATPMGCTSDDNWENACGRSCVTSDTMQWDHYYGDCEGSSLNL